MKRQASFLSYLTLADILTEHGKGVTRPDRNPLTLTSLLLNGFPSFSFIPLQTAQRLIRTPPLCIAVFAAKPFRGAVGLNLPFLDPSHLGLNLLFWRVPRWDLGEITMQQRREEILAKKAKLAELKRQRELRASNQTPYNRTGMSSPSEVCPSPTSLIFAQCWLSSPLTACLPACYSSYHQHPEETVAARSKP